MPRKAREPQQLFYDTFADFPIEEQIIVLRMLQELHRQKVREARRLPSPPMSEKRADDGLFPTPPSADPELLRTYSHRGGPGPEDQDT